jgi:transcriptional regulator with XRE-family HTH domain
MQALRAYLREIRVQKGVSQEELADAIGVSRQQLMRWETGKTAALRGDALLRALGYLNVSFEDALLLVKEGSTQADGYHLAKARLQTSANATENELGLEYVLREVYLLREQLNDVIKDVAQLKQHRDSDRE